jgi:hypothetical protein
MRLNVWKQLRRTIAATSDHTGALDACLSFWRQAPLQSRVWDWDHMEAWPTAWEMLKHNTYCENMHSLGIAETLRLSDDRFSSIQLCWLRDSQAQQEKVVCVWDTWVLNMHHVDRVPRSQLKHVNTLRTWSHTGRQWCIT